ncbi:hypothetical protein TcCL_NonESM10574, partial [Trypanosoma cruzi]
DDVKRTALDSIYSSLGEYDFELWTDVSSSLAELASGSAALLYGSTTTDLPVEVHSAAAGRLASSYRAECLATENGIRHLIPFCLETSQSPTRILVATDSLSITEALRVVPLAVRDYVTEEIWIMLLSLIQRGHSVDFMFSPSHCGIPRNEAADDEAMIARSLPQEGSPIWHVEFLSAVRWPYWRDAQKKGTARTPHKRRLSVWQGLYSWHDPDIAPRAAALRTGTVRLLPTPRHACACPPYHK